jgi:hypothetical protein
VGEGGPGVPRARQVRCGNKRFIRRRIGFKGNKVRERVRAAIAVMARLPELGRDPEEPAPARGVRRGRHPGVGYGGVRLRYQLE